MAVAIIATVLPVLYAAKPIATLKNINSKDRKTKQNNI